MSSSKPCTTWFEMIMVIIVCILIGTCIYISVQDVPARNENTTKSIIPITPVNSASVKASVKSSLKTESLKTESLPSFVRIQLSTPKARPLKLIIIKPEGA
jgi:hypothetical protein